MHGYIDTLNHEINHGNSQKLKLVTKSKEILLKERNHFNYNSNEFTNKILEKVMNDLNNEKILYKNISIEKSILKLSAKNQIRHGKTYHEHSLNFKLYPFENGAIITLYEFNIIAYFKNIITYTKKEGVLNKKYSFEENQSYLLTIPEHSIQVHLNNFNDYNSFKKFIFDILYKDISSVIINELKKVNLPKWNINLNNTKLDIKNIVNDNIQVLTA
jgi:hypothetical protein